MTEKSLFGKTSRGEDVYSYKITNSSGEYVTILSLGAVVHRLCVRDGGGRLRDVVLGFETLREYETGSAYFGALVGRAANRISGCSAFIDGKNYFFPDTGGGVTLHGGLEGFDRKNFAAREFDPAGFSVTLETVSPDGDQGFPGNLSLSVTYTFSGGSALSDGSALSAEYSAVSDAATIVNVTNHSYFNLSGADSGKNIYGTKLKIRGRKITPLGSDFTPTGEISRVRGTVFDFTSFKAIGKDIDAPDPQLLLAGGYDINYVLDGADNADGENGETGADGEHGASAENGTDALPLAAEAYSEESGISLAVFTDRPCMQFYSGNFLTDLSGKDGAPYGRRHGFCLETQGFPDAENKKFPDNIIGPGKEFKSVTVYAFGRR